MHPYYLMKDLLKPIFQKSGHKEISEELHPDVFGSAFSVFDNGRCKIRLIWDGKDGWGYAQTFNQGAREKWQEWQDVSCFLTEGDLESVPQNQEKIEEFCAVVEKIVA